MVAISLYRGNMHRSPDVPRRWLMPTPKISLKDFRSLLQRRNKALSRLRSASSSNPNSDPNPPIEVPRVDGAIVEVKAETGLPEASKPSIVEVKVETEIPEALKPGVCVEVPAELTEKEKGGPEPKGSSEKPGDFPELKLETDGGGGAATAEGDGDANLNLQQLVEKPAEEEAKTSVETIEKVHELNEKEKRKREVEEKLQVLNSNKHGLVQVLKQILNVEEEMKRRNSGQGMAIRGSLQVEVPNDSGSMSREVTPRVGSEANLAGENEGGGADDASNHNVHSRHVFRMSSVSPSPSSESPLRKPPFSQPNVVPHSARASAPVSGSPSRFAPAVNQGHPANLPTVSVSGTNYIASSPSPAASGGTSVFRDARQPSPWN